MSALGQKQTCAVHQAMSALPPKADIHPAGRDSIYRPRRLARPDAPCARVERSNRIFRLKWLIALLIEQSSAPDRRQTILTVADFQSGLTVWK
jgi:hypothetical protein